MRSLRAFLILLSFALFTVPLMFYQLALLAIGSDWARTFPHWYHKKVCTLFGVKVHKDGEVAADLPVFLVSNHTSWLDIPVLSAVAPLSFIAKSEVAKWPFFGWLAKLQRSVFVDRNRRTKVRHTTNEIATRLNYGEKIVLFAEGTSNDGNRVLPFRTALFAAAQPGSLEEGSQAEQACVQTLAIVYTHRHGVPIGREGRPNVAWYGDMDMARHIWKVLQYGPLDVHVKIGEPIALESFKNRKDLAQFTETQIRTHVTTMLTQRPKLI